MSLSEFSFQHAFNSISVPVDQRIVGALSERVLKMERGCVDDQPQQLNTPGFRGVAAAGRGRHSRAPGFQNTLSAAFVCFLAIAFIAPGAFGGTVITNNLPAGTAIINIDARANGATAFNGDQSLWYQPFTGGGSLITYTIEPGTYNFRIVNPADAVALFPSLTSGQAGQIFTAWTYNSPWITDYLVFDSAAATNFALPQIFDGAFSNTNGFDWSAYGSPDDAYSAAISQGFYNLVRTSESGGRSSASFLTEYMFTSTTTLIFAVPDNVLSDNAGGVSVLISPAIPIPRPTLAIAGGGASVRVEWTTNAPGFVLQQAVNLQSTAWTNVATAPAVLDGKFSVTVPVDAPARFFRLSKP